MSPRSAPCLAVTDAAIAKIRQLRQNDTDRVRITIHPTRDLQHRFELEFTDAVSSTETVCRIGGVEFVMGAQTARRMRGSTMDFVESLWEGGFRFDTPVSNLVEHEDLAERAQDAIRRIVNPMLVQHGGEVRLVDLRGRTALVRFGGACRGCSMQPSTMAGAVRMTLMREVPELTGVEVASESVA